MAYMQNMAKQKNYLSCMLNMLSWVIRFVICMVMKYRVYKKKRNLGISQEIDIVLKTKDFRRLGI
jgi:hypothetical protein